MQIAKSWQTNSDPDSNGQITVGDTLTYWVRIQNQGTVTLTNVVVSDPLITPNSKTCASVAPGLSCSLFGTYTVTVSDESAGRIDNTGSATATEIPGPLSINVSTPVVPRPTSMSAQKFLVSNTDPDGNGRVTVGDVLTYEVHMVNIGTQPLSGIQVSDPLTTPSNVSCALVNASGSCILSGVYTVTAADASAGSINNIGSVTSVEIPGPFNPTLSVAVFPAAVASMTVTKSMTFNADGDGNGQVTVGDVLTFTVTATNTGSVGLTNVALSDPLTTPNGNTCAALAVSAACTLTGTYTVTAADASAGSISNVGSATSAEVPGPITSNVTTPVVTLTPAMTILLTLTANADGDGNGQVTVGDLLTYTVVATNTGNTVLNNVAANSSITNPSSNTCATLAVGATCTLTGTYTVTAADATAGSITNSGSATSTEVPGPIFQGLVVVMLSPNKSMTVSKTLAVNADGDGNGQVTVGDVLTYTVAMVNTGNLTLTNVLISDPLLTPSSFNCITGTVRGGGNGCTHIGYYTVTAADAAAGSISNTGSVTSAEIPGPTFSNTLLTPVVTRTTSMRVDKYQYTTISTDPDGNGQVTVGDNVGYFVQMQNTGTQPLTNVVVSDPLLTPNTITCPSVANGGICGLTGIHTVTAADEAAGRIDNTAVATSTEIPGPTSSNTLTIPVIARAPAMTITNSLAAYTDLDGNGQVTAGDVLEISNVLTNTGNVTLNNVSYSSPKTTPAIGCSIGTLAVGATLACNTPGQYTYTVSTADATAGVVTFTTSATSTELPGPLTSVLTVPVLTFTTSMAVTKTLTGNADGDGNGQVSLGDVLTFTVTASNTGNTTLTNVVVSDPITAPSSTTCASVAIGAACTLSGTYTVTAADVTAGNISNTGSATSVQIPVPVTRSVTTAVQAPPVAQPSTPAPISGDLQNLIPGVPSAPLVVEFRSNGVPLVGQTIAWTTTSGTLAFSTTVTDASGRTSNTLTTTAPGQVVVTASFAGNGTTLGSSIDFTLNGVIAEIPTLTPSEVSVAIALDASCAELASLSSRTPAQQDLLNQCLALTASSSNAAVADALEEMLPDVAQVQTQSSQVAASAQFNNINGRMLALRSGSYGSSLAGLSLVGPGASVSLASLGAALLDETAPAKSEQTFERWGLFASGSIGRGEAEPGRQTPAYDFDINGLTVGVDYRKTDGWVLGGALGMTRQDSTLAGQQGSLDTSGWSVSGYSTWYRGDSWYIDSLLSYGRNRYDHRRRIVYSLPLPGGSSFDVDQIAKGSSDGTDLSASATFGRDFHKAAWTTGVYARGLYSRLGFEGFRERLDSTVPGGGLALEVADRNATALSSVIGGKVSYAHSATWGVLVPHVDVEWQREYRSDPETFRAIFVNDPTGTPILVTGEALDSSYWRVGVGLSMVLTRGRSGFLYYVRTVGRDGITQDNLTLGFRMEF